MSRAVINIKNADNNCLLLRLIAYLHPAINNTSRVNNSIQPEYNNETKLPDIGPTYDYNQIQKISEKN